MNSIFKPLEELQDDLARQVLSSSPKSKFGYGQGAQVFDQIIASTPGNVKPLAGFHANSNDIIELESRVIGIEKALDKQSDRIYAIDNRIAGINDNVHLLERKLDDNFQSLTRLITNFVQQRGAQGNSVGMPFIEGSNPGVPSGGTLPSSSQGVPNGGTPLYSSQGCPMGVLHLVVV